MTPKQQKALVNLTAIYAQFGVMLVQQTPTAAYFQAARNAPLEARHIELMAVSLQRQTGLKFMLKPVSDFKLN